MKILIIHHLESEWETAYISATGKTFEELCYEFSDYLEVNYFDKVILTRFEPEHYIIHNSEPLTLFTYSYGWDKYDIEANTDRIWVEGGSHSDFVLIDDWMLDLYGHDVSISGAFDGECIEDLEIALSALQIDYKRIEELII